jgi:restriction endonuclease Mrr
MESLINEEKTKELLTEILIEMMQSKREVFYEIVLEALEEIGLGNAIAEGRKNEFVSEDEVLAILDSQVE